jgi:hypothetical protein
MKRKRIGAILIAAVAGMLALLLVRAGHAQESSPSDSEEKWYQVEVLVFERRGNQVLEEESWDSDPGRPPIEEAIALIAPGESPLEGPGPHAFRILPAEALALSETRGHLERSAETTPILHLAWRQPGVPEDDAQWVNLYLPPRDGNAARAPGNFFGMARRTAVQNTAGHFGGADGLPTGAGRDHPCLSGPISTRRRGSGLPQAGCRDSVSTGH